jgi:hypothetical protein
MNKESMIHEKLALDHQREKAEQPVFNYPFFFQIGKYIP